MNPPKLGSIRITRRVVSIAVFDGTHLEYVKARHLASDYEQAEQTVLGFLDWVISNFNMTTIAMEDENIDEAHRTYRLIKAVTDKLREDGVSIWKVLNGELFMAFGHPPLESRFQMRQVAVQLWPTLDSAEEPDITLDVVALGFHVQVERLFLIN